MAEEQSNEKLRIWTRYLQWIFAFGALAILGSCVSKIDALGGGHDTNQKMAGIFFFHLFLLVPCLFGLFVYLQIKLERYVLDSNEIDRMNEVHMQYARKELKSVLGPLYSRFKASFENKEKKK